MIATRANPEPLGACISAGLDATGLFGASPGRLRRITPQLHLRQRHVAGQCGGTCSGHGEQRRWRRRHRERRRLQRLGLVRGLWCGRSDGRSLPCKSHGDQCVVWRQRRGHEALGGGSSDIPLVPEPLSPRAMRRGWPRHQANWRIFGYFKGSVSHAHAQVATTTTATSSQSSGQRGTARGEPDCPRGGCHDQEFIRHRRCNQR